MPITQDKTKQFWTEAERLVRRNLHAVGKKVKDDAKSFAPVKTGKLQRSIRYFFPKKYKNDKYGKGTTVLVGSRREYAAAVEKGTPTMSAQPYLRPALIKNYQLIKDILRDDQNIMSQFKD